MARRIIAIAWPDGAAVNSMEAIFEEFTENGSEAPMPYIRARFRGDPRKSIEVCKHQLAYVTYGEIEDDGE